MVTRAGRARGVRRTALGVAGVLLACRPAVGAVRSGQGTNYGGLTVSAWHAGGILVADGAGHKTGFDPITKRRYDAIPNSYYDDSTGIDDDETGEPPTDVGREVGVGPPCPSGTYAVTLWPAGSAGIDVEVHAYDATQMKAHDVTLDGIRPNKPGPLVLTITYESNDIEKFSVSEPGAFSGSDASRLLTYASPKEVTVRVAKAKQSYPVSVFYAPSISPMTFHAALNGKDITASFHPRAGGAESILVKGLRNGRNLLTLTISGAGGAPKDADQFELVRE